MTPTDTPYLINVRPRHLETAASYTSRLLTANLDTPQHKEFLISTLTSSTRTAEREAVWLEIMARKTQRDRLHLDTTHPRLVHADGTTCEHCAARLPIRIMCTLCSHGELIHQIPHFDNLVCIRHRRWIGVDGINQHAVGSAHLTAARTFAKLRRRHRIDVRLFTALTEAVSADLSTQWQRPQASDVFPAVVAMAKVITSDEFAAKFYNPLTPFADTYELLKTTIHTVLGLHGRKTTKAIWLYARPTVFAVRHHLTHQTPFALAWPHDLPVNPAIIERFRTIEGTWYPFDKYLLVSWDTPLSEAKAAARIGYRVPLKDSGDFIRDKAYEICPAGHQFVITPANMVESPDRPCPVCQGKVVQAGITDLATTDPAIAEEFAADLNDGLTAQDISRNSKRKVTWRCTAKGHTFSATPSNRVHGRLSCPVCQNRIVQAGSNDLATTRPDLVGELHPSSISSGIATTHTHVSDKLTQWLCSTCAHEYSMRIYDRAHKRSCPNCTAIQNRQTQEGIDSTHPEIAAEWHPILNHEHRPEHFTHGSGFDAYWLCPRGHDYRTRIERRTAGYKCPTCSGRKLQQGFNDLATKEPVLVTEWFNRNRKTPDRIFPGIEKYWWKCHAGHIEHQSVPHRRKSRGCTSCPKENRILNRRPAQ